MFNLIPGNTGMVELELRVYVNMGLHYTLLLCKGPITPSCISTACSKRCKIQKIAVESQEKFRFFLIYLTLWKSEDVTASWRRLRNVERQVGRLVYSVNAMLPSFDVLVGPHSGIYTIYRNIVYIPRWFLLDCV